MHPSSLVFLGACIPTRAGVAIIAKGASEDNIKRMGYIAIAIAIGFLVIYVGGFRQSGPETFGKPLWWNNLRPVHGALWLSFGLLALQNNRKAWILLLIDMIIGLVAHVNQHYIPNPQH